jgi:hypothetical protein
LIVVANKCDVVPEKLAFIKEEMQKQVRGASFPY